MIKLFRNIRQNLILRNKTGKYFKYAIGEIVLVVIGILIALSINNWNESRKQIDKEKKQLTYVLENLKSDSLSIALVIGNQNEMMKVHKELIAVVKGDLRPQEVENVGYIRRSLPHELVTRKNNPNLANEVLSQDLKKHIIDYYSAINWAEFVLLNLNDVITQQVRPFLGEKQLLNYGNQFDGSAQNNNYIKRDKFFEELQKPELQQVLFEAGIKLTNLNLLKNRAAVENENLKNIIITYLSNK